MIWEIITFLALIAVLFLGKKRIFFYVWAFIIGLFVGLWWEFTAETEFNYTGYTIYIWKDIPLAVIIQWGVAIAGFVLISDYLQKKIPISKKEKHLELKNCLFWDIVVTVTIGITMEIAGNKIFYMWTYSPNNMIALFEIPIRWLVGWGWMGIFILAFIRRYGKFFETQKKLKKVRENEDPSGYLNK